MWEWLLPLHSLENPWERKILPDTPGAGQQRRLSLSSIPLLEGIAAQLVHPPFPKGSAALSCFQFPGRQLLGKHWKCWSWQGCPAHHQAVAAPLPQAVSHPSGDRGTLGASPAHLSCSASLRGVLGTGMVLWALTLPQVPPWGHRASLLWGIRAGEGCEEWGRGGSPAAVPVSPVPRRCWGMHAGVEGHSPALGMWLP